jgi:winged helix DNA-binding protein
VPAPTLTARQLNRATLARQMLLARAAVDPTEAIERLVGMQAQAPLAPYVGLWSRVEGFTPDDLAGRLVDRDVVRLALLRSTVHLVTADDARWLRPLLRPVYERFLQPSLYGKAIAGLDHAELEAAGRAVVEARPSTNAELRAALAERWPDRDPAALATVVRLLVPLVQVPPRGLWGQGGQATHTSLEAWLDHPPATAGPERATGGRPTQAEPASDGETGPASDQAASDGETGPASDQAAPEAAATVPASGGEAAGLERLVLRYLATYGPATARDVQVWCGLTRLGEVLDRLRQQLVTFADGEGRELFDLPDAPRPDPDDTPAPVRFLPEYDNLLRSHEDRTRVLDQPTRDRLSSKNDAPKPTFLVDGVVAGGWKLDRKRRRTSLTVEPFVPLPHHQLAAVAAEGEQLLAWATPDGATTELVLLPPPTD